MRNAAISNNFIGLDREGDSQSSQRSRFKLVSEVERTGSPRAGGCPRAISTQLSEESDRRLILETGSAEPAPCPFCCVAINAASRK